MEFDGGSEGTGPKIRARKLKKFVEILDEAEAKIAEVTSQEPEDIEEVRRRLLDGTEED